MIKKDKDRLIAELINMLCEMGIEHETIRKLLIAHGYLKGEAELYYFGEDV